MRRPARQLTRLSAVAALLVAMIGSLVAASSTAVAAAEGVARSQPSDGDVVDAAPATLAIEFEGAVDPLRTDVQVVPPGGGNLVVGQPTISGATLTAQLATDTVDGIHRVIYETSMTLDGSVTTVRGSFRYTLRSGGCSQRVKDTGGFTSILAPTFTSAPEQVVEAAVDPVFEDLIHATNGREVHRTVDGGCTWVKVLDLATELDALGKPGRATIGALATARETPGAIAVVVLDPIDEAAGLHQPIVWSSVAPSRDLTAGAPTLPPIRLDPALAPSCHGMQPCRLKISDAVPRGFVPAVYFLAKPDSALGAAQLLRSDDLGATFSPVGTPVVDNGDAAPLSSALDLATDITNPFAVYFAVGSTIHLSADQGASVSATHPVAGGVVTHLAAGEGTDAASRPVPELLAVVSANDGAAAANQLVRLRIEGQALVASDPIDASPLRGAHVQSIARGPQPNQILILPDTDRPQRPGVFEYERVAHVLRDIDAFEVSPWRSAAATNPLCTRWFGHDGTHLYLVDADDGHDHAHDVADFCVAGEPDALAHSVDIVPFPPSTPDPTEGSVLSPPTTVVSLEPGGAQTVGYRLQRAAEDTPLDVAFLFDTSGSMNDNIEDVRDAFGQVVQSLTEAGVDAWFGLAEFNDLTVRYRRLADIRPPDDVFSTALARVQAGGGQVEPHFTALYELATGEGIAAPGNGAPVHPGGQMNYRPDSVRVVIMASDEAASPDPDGADFTDAVNALVGRNILHVGLHVLPEPRETEPGDPLGTRLRDEMRELSRATGAFAVAPVDCDGDGAADLQRGDPLVCTMANSPTGATGVQESVAVAGALTDLLRAVRTERPFSLVPETSVFDVRIDATGLNGVGPAYPSIDVKRPQNLTFAVRFACTTDEAGRVEEIPLRAHLGELAIAQATAIVHCGVTPAVAAAGVAASQPQVAAVVPPPAAAPPSIPIQANAPASAQSAAQSTATAASSSSAPAGAAAVAPQMQKQTQQAEIRRDDDEFFATPVRARRSGMPTPLVAGMLVASAAGFVELRRRTGVGQPARVGLGRR